MHIIAYFSLFNALLFLLKRNQVLIGREKKTRHSSRKTLCLFAVEEFAAAKGRIFSFLRGSTRKGRAFSIILGFRRKPHATDRVSGILRAESGMILLIVFSIQMKWPFCMTLIVRVVSIC